MTQPYYVRDYQAHTQALLDQYDDEHEATLMAVGGMNPQTGPTERDILIASGLTPDTDLVDIGCGPGRLTLTLDPDRPGAYLGTDIVPELLDRIKSLRPQWRFELVEDLIVPVPDQSVDMVCLYSVITHLRHEDSYALLREAARALRPGAVIVVSFLEFSVPDLWPTFSTTVDSRKLDHPMTVYVERSALEVWAKHLDLNPIAYCPSDRPFVNGLEPLGQSVIVFQRPVG